MFDSEKFNGFMKDEFDNLLFDDILRYWVFNESDLHSAAYYYIRKYFEKRNSDSANDIFVRCEPVLHDGTKPDIVVFQKYDPIYFVEMKMFPKIESINEASVQADLDKLKKYFTAFGSMRWGFFLLAYDSDEMFNYTPYALKRDGYNNISIVGINMRRKEESGRKRVGYDEWRKQFDKYLERHF